MTAMNVGYGRCVSP